MCAIILKENESGRTPDAISQGEFIMTSKKSKKAVGYLMAVAMMVMMPATAFASGWQHNMTGWWYGTNETNTTYSMYTWYNDPILTYGDQSLCHESLWNRRNTLSREQSFGK